MMRVPGDYDRNPPKPDPKEQPTRSPKFAWLIIILLIAAATLISWAATAHEAPTGWQYPYACCSGIDCRPISQSSISERQDGYHVSQNGEVLTYSDARIRESRDGDFHLCTVAGEDHSRTICLFVPPRGF